MHGPTSCDSGGARAPAASACAGGFTLVEMLVVIGIIVVIVGIALPMVTRAWRQGDRTRMAADLQTIGTALEAYRQDHGDYPRVNMTISGTKTGSQVLCDSLVAPGDADLNPGLGFRTRAQGKVWGPYLKTGEFKLSVGNTELLDRYNKPILYFPASPARPDIRRVSMPGSIPSYVHQSEISLYDANDNLQPYFTRGASTDGIKRIRLMLGDANFNGLIDGTETPAHTGPFLLWSAGPDEIYGPDADLYPGSGDTTLDAKDAEKCDDVTNFRQ